MKDIAKQSVKEYVDRNGIGKGGVLYSRKTEHKAVRYYLFYYLRSYKVTFEEIGNIFNLDHSSIVHGVNRWEEYRKYQDMQDFTEYVRYLFPMNLTGATTDSKHMRIVQALGIMEKSLVTKGRSSLLSDRTS